ncbi:uncharacterized protein LOC144526599 isoform X2 [Sander vitreus]
MYKSVLLVLLGLQVFLLITSFTSADAAALVPVDQRQQDSPDLIDLNGKDKKIPNTPNPPPLLALDKTRVKTEQA